MTKAKQYWVYDLAGNFVETHLYFVKPKNSTDIKPLVNPKYMKWNGSEWIVPEDKQFQLYLEQEKANMKRRITDGINAVAEMTAEFNLAVRMGLISESVNIASHNELVTVRAEITNGCWDKALKQLQTNVNVEIIGQSLYNRIETTITNYLNNPDY